MALNDSYDFSILEDEKLDTIDSGGFITVPGWYLVTVEDVEDEDGKKIFSNRVAAGPFKGSTCKFFLPAPELADDEKLALTRLGAVAKRLGLLTAEFLKAEKAAGRRVTPDWLSAINKQFWLQLEAKVQEKGKHAGQTMCNPTYIPYYPLNDERVPEAARKSNGAAAIMAAANAGAGTAAAPTTQLVSAGAGAASNKPQWSDL